MPAISWKNGPLQYRVRVSRCVSNSAVRLESSLFNFRSVCRHNTCLPRKSSNQHSFRQNDSAKQMCKHCHAFCRLFEESPLNAQAAAEAFGISEKAPSARWLSSLHNED